MPKEIKKPATNPTRGSDLPPTNLIAAKTSTTNPPPAHGRPRKSEPKSTPSPEPRCRKTISPAQLAANRANAKKSTGPRTPEGKARSSRNALKHGLLARHLVLGDNDPDEVRQEFRTLLLGLLDAYRPRTHAEKALVHTIAACYWRLRRALRFETQSILAARHRAAVNCTPPTAAGTPVAPDPCAGHEIEPHPDTICLPDATDLERLIIYESAIQRDLARAHRELDRIRQPHRRKRAECASAQGATAHCSAPR